MYKNLDFGSATETKAYSFHVSKDVLFINTKSSKKCWSCFLDEYGIVLQLKSSDFVHSICSVNPISKQHGLTYLFSFYVAFCYLTCSFFILQGVISIPFSSLFSFHIDYVSHSLFLFQDSHISFLVSYFRHQMLTMRVMHSNVCN